MRAPEPNYNQFVELEKTLLRKVGEAVHRFKMIRDGDRVAVALSGGKDSLTLLEALLLLAKRAPVDFSVCAFTVEQGKFLRPIEPLGDYLRQRGVAWTYFRDNPSLRLLEEQPRSTLPGRRGAGQIQECQARLRLSLQESACAALQTETLSSRRRHG